MFGTVILYDTSLYFLKFSVLWFYHLLFPIGPSKLRLTLYLGGTITVACFFTATFMAIFWCGTNVSQHWQWDENGISTCSFSNKQLFVADWAMNIGTDVVILLLPFPLLTKLLLSWWQVGALCITFGLGAITMVVSTMRFMSVMRHDFLPLCELRIFNYYCNAHYRSDVYSVAEISTGMVVVSIPALRPLLRRAAISTPTLARQNSPQSMPWRRLSGPRLPPNLGLSQQDHRPFGGHPLSGYRFSNDPEKNSSEVELQGRFKSDAHTNAATVAVYIDQPKEVLIRQGSHQATLNNDSSIPLQSQIRNT
jgi:hypothetical protein